MLNWLNRELGASAPIVGALAVIAAILSGGLAYHIARTYGTGCTNEQISRPSEVKRDNR
jgi:hypothetical protein